MNGQIDMQAIHADRVMAATLGVVFAGILLVAALNRDMD